MTEKLRPGREWNQHEVVCPRQLAEAGQFVKATIVRLIEIDGYTPPTSSEYQTRIYIVEWSAPTQRAPLEMAFGAFLGNDLLPLEAAAHAVLRVIHEQKDHAAIQASNFHEGARAARAFLIEAGSKFDPSYTGGRMADG